MERRGASHYIAENPTKREAKSLKYLQREKILDSADHLAPTETICKADKEIFQKGT
jgi:hypothetical protein